MDSVISKRRTSIIENLLAAIVSFNAFGFEKLILSLLTADGSTGALTPTSGDNGIDVAVNSADGLIVAQCKAYSCDNRVSPKEVREFLGAVVHANAVRGYFFTTSTFTDQAREFAEANQKLILVDRNSLEELLLQSLFSTPSVTTPSDTRVEVDEITELRRLAEHGRFDEALEKIWQIAPNLSALRNEVEAKELRLAELNHEIGIAVNNRSALEKHVHSYNGWLSRLAILDNKDAAGGLEQYKSTVEGAFKELGVSVTEVISAMRNEEYQTLGGGDWIAQAGGQWPPEEYIRVFFSEFSNSGGLGKWLVINRRTHLPVAWVEKRLLDY